MKCFASFKRCIQLIGILREEHNRNKEILLKVFNFAYIVNFVVVTLTAAWFFLDEARTLLELAKSVFFSMVGLLISAWYFTYLWHQKTYADLFGELDLIITKRSKNPDSNAIYTETNGNVETLTNIVQHALVKVLATFFAISAAVVSLVKYISSGHSSDSFQQPYPAKYPFEWRTPVGYLACICSQILTSFAAAEIFACTLVIVVGFCLFITSFITDLEQDLHQLNVSFAELNEEKWSYQKRLEVKRRLFDIIQFHADAKEFTSRSLDTNKGLIFAFLLFAIISFCIIFLQANMLITDGNLIEILQASVTGVTPVCWLYLFCHFGSTVTERFETVGDKVYEINWYSLPIYIQMNIPMMIQMRQKRIYLQGFGNTRCTREVFKKILNSSFSYFMVLRSLDV